MAQSFGGFDERGGVKQFERREDFAGSFGLREPRVGIGQRAESEIASGAQKGDGFGDQIELGFEMRAVS